MYASSMDNATIPPLMLQYVIFQSFSKEASSIHFYIIVLNSVPSSTVSMHTLAT